MAQRVRYYAVYTGSGDGEVMHCVWADAEERVADLLRGNAKARHHGFDNEAEAINFARTGMVFDDLKDLD